MSRVYGFLAIAGWVWLVVLFGYLLWKSRRKEPRGFEVERSKES